jgi:hypothetical protein
MQAIQPPLSANQTGQVGDSVLSDHAAAAHRRLHLSLFGHLKDIIKVDVEVSTMLSSLECPRSNGAALRFLGRR